MRRAMGTAIGLLLACEGIVACATAESRPESPAEDAATRSEVTASDCEAKGGVVVGDIGDGAIHRAEYRCPSGAAPSAKIRSGPEGEPMGVEGSVCCPK